MEASAQTIYTKRHSATQRFVVQSCEVRAGHQCLNTPFLLLDVNTPEQVRRYCHYNERVYAYNPLLLAEPQPLNSYGVSCC
jgi:hypothetical protein